LFIIFKIFGENPGFDGFQVKLLYGAFTTVTIIGVILFASLKMPRSIENVHGMEESQSDLVDSSTPQNKISSIPELVDLWKKIYVLASSRQMILMSVVFMHTGVVLSFWSSIYSVCIVATKKLAENTKILMALNEIALGVGQATAGYIFGIAGTNVPRKFVLLIGTVVHLISFLAIALNIPSDAPLGHDTNSTLIGPSAVIALACGLALGFGDACWNTQIFSFLLENNPNQSAEAFSIFKFFQSFTASIIFLMAGMMNLYMHLLILTIGSVFSLVIVFLVDKGQESIEHPYSQ